MCHFTPFSAFVLCFVHVLRCQLHFQVFSSVFFADEFSPGISNALCPFSHRCLTRDERSLTTHRLTCHSMIFLLLSLISPCVFSKADDNTFQSKDAAASPRGPGQRGRSEGGRARVSGSAAAAAHFLIQPLLSGVDAGERSHLGLCGKRTKISK